MGVTFFYRACQECSTLHHARQGPLYPRSHRVAAHVLSCLQRGPFACQPAGSHAGRCSGRSAHSSQRTHATVAGRPPRAPGCNACRLVRGGPAASLKEGTQNLPSGDVRPTAWETRSRRVHDRPPTATLPPWGAGGVSGPPPASPAPGERGLGALGRSVDSCPANASVHSGACGLSERRGRKT